MASFLYNRGAFSLSTNGTSFTADTIKVMLVTSGYTELRTHNVVSDVVASEVGVAGYSRQTLANKTVTEDDGNNQVEFDADNVTFSALASGATVHGAIVFEDTGSDATAPLLCFIDLTNTATNGGDFVLSFDANGIFALGTA